MARPGVLVGAVFSVVTLLLACGPALVPAQANDAASSNSSCSAAGLHMIVARGSSESPGLGVLAALASNVTKKLPQSTTAGVDYPATFDEYFTSEAKGVKSLTGMIHEHISDCPDSKIALLGYSQGGQVSMDVICGTSESFFDGTPDLTSKYRENIVAVVTFGDPSHVVDMPWDVGTSNRNGIFERQNTSACEPYSGIIRSYCDDGDFYCDRGSKADVHGGYLAKYTDDAVDFIVSKFNDSGEGSSNSTTTGSTPTSTSTGTSPSSSSSGSRAESTYLLRYYAAGLLLVAFVSWQV